MDKENTRTAVVLVNRSEPYDPSEFHAVINKGIVIDENERFVQVWACDDPTINLTPNHSEWFAKNSKRVKVVISEPNK